MARLSKLLLALLGTLMWPGGGGEPPPQFERDQGPWVKHFVAPRYPALARQANIQGDVTATLHLRQDGTVESASDVRGPALLRDSAVQALRLWTFELTTDTKTDLSVTVHFSLEGAEDERVLIFEVSGDLPRFIKVASNPFPRRSFPDNVLEQKPVH